MDQTEKSVRDCEFDNFVSDVVWDPDSFFVEEPSPILGSAKPMPKPSTSFDRQVSSASASGSTQQQQRVRGKGKRKGQESRRVGAFTVKNGFTTSFFERHLQKEEEESQITPTEPPIPKFSCTTTQPNPARPSEQIDLPADSSSEKVSRFLEKLGSESSGEGPAKIVTKSKTLASPDMPADKKQQRPQGRPLQAQAGSSRQLQQAAAASGPTLPPAGTRIYLEPVDEIPSVNICKLKWKFLVVGDAAFLSREQLKREGSWNVIVVNAEPFKYKTRDARTGRIKEVMDTLEEFTAKLTNHCEAQVGWPKVYECLINGYYCAKYEENWYRVRILEGGRRCDSDAKAFFIDHGWVHSIPKENLRFLSREFTSGEEMDGEFKYPSQALHAQIKFPGCAPDEVKKIKSELSSFNCKVEFQVDTFETKEVEVPLLTLSIPFDWEGITNSDDEDDGQRN